jgi:hypothetical protein
VSETDAFMRRVSNGNESAYRFVCDLTEVLHFWDDLVDRDAPVPDDLINRRMRQALIYLPRSLFYRDHFVELSSLLEAAIDNWIAANTLERVGDHDDKGIAFIIRSSYVDILIRVGKLCGVDGERLALEARQFIHSETFSGYLENLATERLAREGA